MTGTLKQHSQPLAYRIWNPQQRSFFYSDVRPQPSAMLDRWTGFFDKEGLPIYERDILRVHYNWKLGWVRALVLPHERMDQYLAQATDVEGNILTIGFYSFAEAYRIGNQRQHPYRLTTAQEHFGDAAKGLYWFGPASTRSASSLCAN